MLFRTSVLLLVGLSLLINGCVLSRGRVGNPIQEESLSQIEKGITKKESVVTLLGAPDRIIVGNDKEIFQYYYYDGKSPGLILLVFNILSVNVRSDNLYVFFDRQGIVQDVIYGKRTPEVDFTIRPWGK
ncbi:MAG: outer membrane protein assembly factor BamE [Nitrospira sp.]|nr:outer membrane protein assembly factor BamE [Nitrospira sp.]